jgi:hypothetical protein
MQRSPGLTVLAIALGVATSGASEAPTDSERIAQALARWDALNPAGYSYDLGIGIGSPFGYGEFHVKVKGEKCLARHYRGVGLGRPTFLERIRYRPCKAGYLPRELMNQIAEDVSRGRYLEDIQLHPAYEFIVGATTDTDKLVNQTWSFEIRDFKMQERRQ